MRKMRNAYKILVRKPEGKKPFGRSRNKWEDNIKTVPKYTGRECVWTSFIWLKIGTSCLILVNKVMNLWVP
jgi:hypothetical protein